MPAINKGGILASSTTETSAPVISLRPVLSVEIDIVTRSSTPEPTRERGHIVTFTWKATTTQSTEPLVTRVEPAVVELFGSSPTDIEITIDGTVQTSNSTIIDFSANQDYEDNMGATIHKGDVFTAEILLPDTSLGTYGIKVKANAATFGAVNGVGGVQGPSTDTLERFIYFDTRNRSVAITGTTTGCTITRTIADNEYLNDVLPENTRPTPAAGGAFNGVMECINVDNYLYMVIQIQKHRINSGNSPLIDNVQQAGAILARVDTASANFNAMHDCDIEIIKTYPYITTAARSLSFKEIDGQKRVYWIEGSHYMYSAFFRDVDDITEFTNAWTKDVGNVFYYVHMSTHADTNIRPLGINWRSATTTDNPDHNDSQDEEVRNVDYFYGVHGGTISPIVIDDDGTINLWTGYGTQEDILAIANTREETVFDKVDNWQWIQYDNKLNRRIDLLETNEKTGFDIIKDIAAITNSIIGFNNKQFYMIPRDPKRGKLQVALGQGGSCLLYTSPSPRD